MAARNTHRAWGWVTKLLHWAMAVLIIGTAILVLHVNDSTWWFKSSAPVFLEYIHWHKAFGLIALVLLLIRMVWRWRGGPAPVLPDASSAEEKAALWAHRSLYILMLVVPLSGWVASSAFGSPTKFWGLFTVPGIIPTNKPLVGPAYWTHFILSWTLLSLVGFHVVAAFWHHLVRKDGVLRGMWFGRG